MAQGSYTQYTKKGEKFWRVRVRIKNPFTGAWQEKKLSGFKTKKEAQKAHDKYIFEYEQGYEQTDETLRHWLNFWLEEVKKKSLRSSTYASYKNAIDGHILPYFKDILLKDVKPEMYQKFINYEDKRGLSKRTIEIVHSVFYSAMKKATAIYKIQNNPCEDVEIKGRVKYSDCQYIPMDLIDSFVEAAYNDNYNYGALFEFMIYTGLRKGEACALQWTDLDLQESTISITKSLDFQGAANNPEAIFGETKTYHSNRVIELPERLLESLRNHQKKQFAYKTIYHDHYKHEYNLIFCRDNGDFLPKSTLFNALNRVKNLVPGVGSDLRIHDLRHTHAVLLKELDADDKYIQERLGHKNIEITLNIYSHITKTIGKRNVKKIDDYLKRKSM